MTASIPTTEPTRLRAGDTWQWRREDLADYPAGTWVLTYRFRNASDFFDVVASADGTAHAVTVAMATTAAKVPGDYDWVAMVESATERHEIGAGRITLLANLATQAAADLRSFARRMLEAIEASLEGRAGSDQLDLVNATLADRGIQRDRAGLMSLRKEFQAEVRREDTRAKGASPYRILAVG